MKAHPSPQPDPRLRGAGRDLAARVESLFGDSPALCGFVVRIEHGSLVLTDLETSPQLGPEHRSELFGVIAATLSELLDERPELAVLMRDRTFARVVH